MGSLEAAGNARRVAVQARRAARGRARAQTGVARARRDSARSSAAVRDVRRGTAVACFPGQGRTASIGDERAYARTIGQRQSCRASGGSKPGPYRLASSRARATKRAGPSARMNCSAPPVQAGKPMPKIEPMLPSALLASPPACRQRAAFRFGADQHGRGAVDGAGGVARRVHMLDALKRRVVAQRHRVEAERPELGERRLERAASAARVVCGLMNSSRGRPASSVTGLTSCSEPSRLPLPRGVRSAAKSIASAMEPPRPPVDGP